MDGGPCLRLAGVGSLGVDLIVRDGLGDVVGRGLAFVRQTGERGDGDVAGVGLEEAAQCSRVSLRPKPSVPSVMKRRSSGTQFAIWSGTAFM